MKQRARQARNRILDDHRAIQHLTERLVKVDSAPAALGAIEELLPLLIRHFREEELEVGGLFDAIRTATPERQAALEQLCGEHRELLTSVQRLRELLGAPGSRPGAEAVRQHGVALELQLRTHEAHETEVYLDSIWNELGEGE